MNEMKVRRRVFALKLAAVGLDIFAAIWLCVYTFAFFPKTVHAQTENPVGIFAVAFASGLAIAVILAVILIVCFAVILAAGLGCAFVCLERKYSPLGGKNFPRRFSAFRIVADVLLLAAGVALLVFGFSLGNASLPPMLPSLVAAIAVFAAVAAAEVIQGVALKKAVHSSEE